MTLFGLFARGVMFKVISVSQLFPEAGTRAPSYGTVLYPPSCSKYVNMALNVHRNRMAYWGRGEGWGAKGGTRGEGDYIPVATLSPPTTRMTPALRWTAMRVILLF